MNESHVSQLLQRSLDRNRLAHAWLFAGDSLDTLESTARALAKALNCTTPRKPDAPPLSSCGHCDACRRIDHDNHPDVLWVRPESKSRIITIDQIRDVMQTVNLKPTIAGFKVNIIVAADRLSVPSANAFLKTLEEPPPKSILILLTTEPQRILETILSRCLRLNFGGDDSQALQKHCEWLAPFSELAAQSHRGLLARYRLLGLLSKKLSGQRAQIEEALAARSPLERYDDLDPKMREKFEGELEAAVEAEYRRQRSDVLAALQWWLRDVWLQTIPNAAGLLCFPEMRASAETVGKRISQADAMANLEHLDRLQRQLNSNVQETLALEVGLLKLKL